MATGDVFENEMRIVDAVDYLRGLVGKDSVAITLNNLLGGAFIGRGSLVKYNDTSLKNGIYDDFNVAIDRDSKLITYGILLVFAVGESMIVQMHIGTNQVFHIRIFASRSWSGWKSITLT